MIIETIKIHYEPSWEYYLVSIKMPEQYTTLIKELKPLMKETFEDYFYTLEFLFSVDGTFPYYINFKLNAEDDIEVYISAKNMETLILDLLDEQYIKRKYSTKKDTFITDYLENRNNQ